MKLPECLHEGKGEDFECGYDDEDLTELRECENCLCNYKTIGATTDPRTNKKANRIVCLFLYGLPCTHYPDKPWEKRPVIELIKQEINCMSYYFTGFTKTYICCPHKCWQRYKSGLHGCIAGYGCKFNERMRLIK
jgi:hypothetical protein